MKASVRFLRLTLSPVVLVAVCLPVILAQRVDDAGDVQVTPSELHRMMGEYKAMALEKVRRAQAPAAFEVPSTQTNYDVLFYDIFIRVDDTTEILYGSVGFVAKAAEPGVNEIEVDFQSNMFIDSIMSPAGALGYSRVGNVVTITLDKAYDADEHFEFVFFYHGHPVEGGLQAFDFSWHDGERIISSLSEPYFARTWWPCKDRMDDKADSFDIAIEVDTSFYVASNGTLDSVGAGGANTHTYYYRVRYPMVTYLFSVVIHPFTVWTDEYVYNSGLDTMPIVHAVYPDWYETSLTSYDITPLAIQVYSEHYGEYPFVNEKYGHANFQWGGAMEHQTMSSMAGTWFGFREQVIVHELSHQWWGDMITCESWADIWLNEGWASYSEALYYLGTDGWAHYHAYMDSMAYYGGGTVYCDDTTDVWRIFHGGLSYDKGAWVVHMLRGVLGDSLFYEGINAYYHSEYQHGAATTEKFKNVWEAATGRELDSFFEDWIYGEYYPRYRYQFTHNSTGLGDYDIYLWVSQIQTSNPQVFRMPVDCYFDFSAIPDDTLTFQVEERSQLFRYTAPSTVLDVQLDPAGWILKDAASQPWTMHIITFDEDLSEAVQYAAYTDTVHALGGSGAYTFTLASGAMPGGVDIDTNGIISGRPADTGLFTFTVDCDDNGYGYVDRKELTVHVTYKELVAGDVDFTDGIVDIGDVTYLIRYLYIQGPEPPVFNLADVNADCIIDIGDLTDLIKYLYIDGDDPKMGCVD